MGSYSLHSLLGLPFTPHSYLVAHPSCVYQFMSFYQRAVFLVSGWELIGPVDGPLGCFQFLTITNKATVDICMQVSVRSYAFSSLG